MLPTLEEPMWTFQDNEELLRHFEFLVNDYALADDATLSGDSLELKQRLLKIVRVDQETIKILREILYHDERGQGVGYSEAMAKARKLVGMEG